MKNVIVVDVNGTLAYGEESKLIQRKSDLNVIARFKTEYEAIDYIIDQEKDPSSAYFDETTTPDYYGF